ncbi:MAG: DNA repair protein RadC [Candidatus Levybacteria bacterium]|nr:DNA repair protein RadC [Candidatus Levybacteria bacterium]
MNKNSSPRIEKQIKNHSGAGHRGRLRLRFLQGGLNAFLDYEIVELLLTLGTPRKDCKQMAKEAIKMFRGLRGVLDASLGELQRIKGIGPSNSIGIKLFQAVSERYAKEQIPNKIIFDSSKAVAEFLQKSIGRKKKEHFVMLSLDSRNNLIKDTSISVGSLNASIVHPREVFKEAIQSSAAQIIIAHNHPSENPDASPEDVALTRRLGEAAKILGIELLDHIIVTKNKFSSLKELGLML